MSSQHKERHIITLLILGAIFIGIFIMYNKERGDSDTKFHFYYVGSKIQPKNTIENLDNHEVNKTFLLDAFKGASYPAKEAGDYKIVISPVEKSYNITVYDRDTGGTDDMLIIIKDKTRIVIKSLDTISLIPVFYFETDVDEQEKQSLMDSYKEQFPSYKYISEGLHELPVRVDYGFDESVPMIKGTPIRRRGHGLFDALFGGNKQNAYYVLADNKRLRKIDQISR